MFSLFYYYPAWRQDYDDSELTLRVEVLRKVWLGTPLTDTISFSPPPQSLT
jgi:hypothetical protein